MIRIDIHQAKTHVSRYLARLKQHERILICRRNVPIAELRPLPSESRTPRPFGLAKGLFTVPADFHAPLAEAEIERWYGG